MENEMKLGLKKNNTEVVLAVSATEGLIRAVPCHFLD